MLSLVAGTQSFRNAKWNVTTLLTSNTTTVVHRCHSDMWNKMVSFRLSTQDFVLTGFCAALFIWRTVHPTSESDVLRHTQHNREAFVVAVSNSCLQPHADIKRTL